MKKQFLTLIALILLGGCSSGDNGRYQAVTNNQYFIGVLDTRTGKLYNDPEHNEQGGYRDYVKKDKNEQGN